MNIKTYGAAIILSPRRSILKIFFVKKRVFGFYGVLLYVDEFIKIITPAR